MSNNSTCLTERTPSETTTPGLSGPGSDGNEGVLRIPKSFSITGASPSHGLMLYHGHSLGKFYPSAEMQSVPGPNCSQLCQARLDFEHSYYAQHTTPQEFSRERKKKE